LNNCIKHSEAREIGIGMQVVEGKLMLSIRDNGKGFDLSENTFSEGQGLLNLRTRAKLIHGTISISSTPGDGTSIIIEKSM
jgi:signal transduction histidine kinase